MLTQVLHGEKKLGGEVLQIMHKKCGDSLESFNLAGLEKTRGKLEVQETGRELACQCLQQDQVFSGQSFFTDTVIVERHNADQFTAGVKSDDAAHPGPTKEIRGSLHDFFRPLKLLVFEVDCGALFPQKPDKIRRALPRLFE